MKRTETLNELLRSIDTGHVLLAAVNNSESPVASALGLSFGDSPDLEAKYFQLRPICPAYVLMGMLSGNGIAVRVLTELGFEVETMRCNLRSLIDNR